VDRIPNACSARARRESDRTPSRIAYRHVQGFG